MPRVRFPAMEFLVSPHSGSNLVAACMHACLVTGLVVLSVGLGLASSSSHFWKVSLLSHLISSHLILSYLKLRKEINGRSCIKRQGSCVKVVSIVNTHSLSLTLWSITREVSDVNHTRVGVHVSSSQSSASSSSSSASSVIIVWTLVNLVKSVIIVKQDTDHSSVGRAEDCSRE